MADLHCEWCDIDERVKPRLRLCARCAKLKKAEDEARALAAQYEARREVPDPWRDGHDIRVALKRAELARREGLRFGRTATETIMPGLTLEHELDFISQAALGDKKGHVYYGTASILERDWNVGEQKRILELLKPLGRAIFRKHFDHLVGRELLAEDSRAEQNRQ